MLSFAYKDRMKSSFKYEGRMIKLNLAFDVVLRMFDMRKDKNFSDMEKVNITLDMLIRNRRVLWGLTNDQRIKMVEQIFSDFINPRGPKNSSKERTFDFNQDTESIYASFMMDYGMDLTEQMGLLDWRKFIALFKGLSDNTTMRKIMDIRGRKLPKPTKYNAEEIKSIQEAKLYYALNVDEEEGEEQFEESLDRLANTLEQRARTV